MRVASPVLLPIIMSLGGPPLNRDADPVWHFSGRFYGVSASAELDMSTRAARVSLRGIPLGGLIEGYGSLDDPQAESGCVVLDPKFEAALARRFVSIDHAALNRMRQTVSVHVRIPILGKLELEIPRVYPE